MPESAAATFKRVWPDAGPTPLIDLPALAQVCGVRRVMVKDESARPLGNFKSLGGTYAGLRALARATGEPVLICASAGNHGLAVAAAAQFAGAKARIYVYPGVSETRLARLVGRGAELVHVAGTYDDAVEAAMRAAAAGEGLLIADISDRVDDPVLDDVAAGYDVMVEEIVRQLPILSANPTHVFAQAGVGGLAAAVVDGLGRRLQRPPVNVVVEPAAARCVAAALDAGRPVSVPGDLSSAASMLNCGQVSAPALQMLLRYPVATLGVDDATLLEAVDLLSRAGGPATTASGAAGLAGLLVAQASAQTRAEIGLTTDSEVLLVVTEGPAA